MRTALILGGAACVWDDLAAYTVPRDGVVACNDAGAAYSGDLTAWVSLHPERFTRWTAARTEAGRDIPPLVSHRQPNGPHKVRMDLVTGFLFPGQEAFGSSGLYAAKVALIDLGFDAVVFCGVPMTPAPHFFGGPAWDAADNFRAGWEQVPEHYRARMRSMSGWTRDLLGAPQSSLVSTAI